MPRRIDPRWIFDAIEDEILFTQAALKADEDATDLLPLTEPWLGAVDEARQGDREVRRASVDADASRTVANGRLDASCTDFGDELFLACRKDRSSARWRQFFVHPVSRFIRRALGRQVATVRGWLTSGSSDDVLEKYREPLTKWSDRADEATVRTQAVAPKRGQNWARREALAEDLTRERDALHESLAARAREQSLPRGWPDLFFRRSRRPAAAPTDTAPTDTE